MANESTAIQRGSAATTREGFGETSIERRGETSSTALAARAQAEVNARYVMALQRPRDTDEVRRRLLKECDRPSFAQRAFYSLPKGNKPGRLTGRPNCIEGLSVRFAEAAIRLAGNILQQTTTIYDDDFKRMIRLTVTDLETNAAYERELVIEKTVERAKPKDGAVILGMRENSDGKTVFIVQATEDELLQKEANLAARIGRTLGLKLVPADVLEDCEQRIVNVWRDEDAKDPSASRKRVLDSFAALGVPMNELKEYLGHAGEMLSANERLELGALHNAIKDGEIGWSEALAEKRRQRHPDAEAAAGPGGVAEKLRQKVDERKARGAGTAKLGAGPAAPGTAGGAYAKHMTDVHRAPETADAPPPDHVVTVGDPREREPGQEG